MGAFVADTSVASDSLLKDSKNDISGFESDDAEAPADGLRVEKVCCIMTIHEATRKKETPSFPERFYNPCLA